MAAGAPPGPRPGPGPALVTNALAGSRRRCPSRTRAIQRSGLFDLAVARQRLGALPQARQRGLAAGVGDGADEDLALLVLLELEVHAGQAEHRALERRPLRASLVEARADPLDVRDQVVADLVHDVVAEALEQAHHGLGLAEQAALLLAHEPLHPVLAAALAAERASEAAHGLAAEPAHVAAEQASAAARAATRGTAAARGAPRTRRRGSSRAARSRSGTGRAARPARVRSRGCSPRRTADGRAPPPPTAARCRTGRARAGP